MNAQRLLVPTLLRENAAGDAPTSCNAGALRDEFPRRSVGTMQLVLHHIPINAARDIIDVKDDGRIWLRTLDHWVIPAVPTKTVSCGCKAN